MIREAIARVSSGTDLTPAEAGEAMEEIMRGAATPAQIGGFLTALRMKGETEVEIAAFARVMRAAAVPVFLPGPEARVDTCGTGGDGVGTFNISTAAAFVAAGAGVSVVKHGNRGVSSRCGSADVLEALGVDLSLSPERVVEVAEQAGITFCFAQTFHPSFRHTAVPRRELGIGSALNFLGPLTNPAQPTFAAIGCADAGMAPLLAGVFASRGKDAAVFRGDDGLDEVTVATTTRVWWVRNGQIGDRSIDPTRLGLELHPTEALRGGDAMHNAQVVREVFAGATGAVRDAVLLNAGIALALTEPDSGATQADFDRDLRTAMDRAAVAIDSGAASRVIDRWVEATHA